MPLPETESLSVIAPRLYFKVRLRPLSRSNIKKRLNFCAKVAFGTFTSGITSCFPVFGLWSLVLVRFFKSNVFYQRPKAEDQRPDQMNQVAGTAGFPFGTFTNLMFRRCVLRLKSRERQLIRDNRKPVINRPINPKTIIIPLPV